MNISNKHKEQIDALSSGDIYVISFQGSGIKVCRVGSTFDVYEWLPDQPEFKVGSYFSWETDEVVGEIESWERF